MTQSQTPKKPQNTDDAAAIPSPPDKAPLSREEKLAKQLRNNLAKRKTQSRARKTKPRKFNSNDG